MEGYLNKENGSAQSFIPVWIHSERWTAQFRFFEDQEMLPATEQVTIGQKRKRACDWSAEPSYPAKRMKLSDVAEITERMKLLKL